jgi:outer membrane protein assembly factor BamB
MLADEQQPPFEVRDTVAGGRQEPAKVETMKTAAAVLAGNVRDFEETWKCRPGLWVNDILPGRDGSLYLSVPCEVAAVSAGGGKPVQHYPIGQACVYGVLEGEDRKVYVTTNQGDTDRMIAFDRDTGREAWSKDCRAGTFHEQSVAGPDGTLFCASTSYGGGDDYRLVAVNSGDGSARWQFRAGGRIQGKPLFTGTNSVVFGSQDHKLYSLDASTGKKQWDHDSGAPVACPPILGADGSIICLNREGMLTALDPSTGDEKWSCNCGGAWKFSSGAPVCGPDGTIFVADPSTESHVMAIDGKTGKLRWKESRQIWLEAPLVVNTEGTLFVGAKDLKTVFIYDGATGADMGKLEIGEPVTSLAFDEKKKTLLCGTSDGSLVAFKRLSPEERTAAERQSAASNQSELQVDDDTIYIDELKMKINR